MTNDREAIGRNCVASISRVIFLERQETLLCNEGFFLASMDMKVDQGSKMKTSRMF